LASQKLIIQLSVTQYASLFDSPQSADTRMRSSPSGSHRVGAEYRLAGLTTAKKKNDTPRRERIHHVSTSFRVAVGKAPRATTSFGGPTMSSPRRIARLARDHRSSDPDNIFAHSALDLAC
jgi:hypothetical protein